MVEAMACPCQPPKHFHKQNWLIVNWTFINNFQLNQSAQFCYENAFAKNV